MPEAEVFDGFHDPEAGGTDANGRPGGFPGCYFGG